MAKGNQSWSKVGSDQFCRRNDQAINFFLLIYVSTSSGLVGIGLMFSSLDRLGEWGYMSFLIVCFEFAQLTWVNCARDILLPGTLAGYY